MRKLRRALANFICLHRGHDERCTMALNLFDNTIEHTHTCARCQEVRFSKIYPVSPVSLVLDPGLPIPEKRKYLN